MPQEGPPDQHVNVTQRNNTSGIKKAAQAVNNASTQQGEAKYYEAQGRWIRHNPCLKFRRPLFKLLWLDIHISYENFRPSINKLLIFEFILRVNISTMVGAKSV